MKKRELSPRPPRVRVLSDEEIDLWIAVAKSVTVRHGHRLPPRLEKPPEAEDNLAPEPKPEAVPQPVLPKKPSVPALSGVERRLKVQLGRGRTGVDDVLDLHGMHQNTAFSALRHFLSTAQRNGARLVLVITGKGERLAENSYELGGVLRRSVPHWLSAPELRSIVVGFEEANRPHGGAGALYVQIRRRDRIGGRMSRARAFD
jgi:DNA-nicking Smr family endonuclease